MRFDNKTVLITGGSSGIGKSIASKFISEGAHVIVFGLKKPDNDVKFYSVDVSSEEQIKKAFSHLKKVDILINNAGVNLDKDVENTEKEELDKIININFNGTYLMCKNALPLLKKTKGNIVNIASISGFLPESTNSAYCSTKAAVIMLTRCLSQEYSKTNVRVNAVAPGMINTNMLNNAFSSKNEMRISMNKVPMKRIGYSKEVANVVAFLASDEASYVNGSVYVVDGGHSNTSIF